MLVLHPMSIYNSQRRFFLSAFVAVGFAGLYLLFRTATSPFLDVEREKLNIVTSPLEMEEISRRSTLATPLETVSKVTSQMCNVCQEDKPIHKFEWAKNRPNPRKRLSTLA